MNRYQKYLLPVLVLGLLVAIALGFRSFFMPNVVEPIAVLFWAVWRIIISVDQNIYWAILITICALFIIRLITLEDQQSANSAYHYRHPSPNRVEYWRTLLHSMSHRSEQAEELRVNLIRLMVAVSNQTGQSKSANLEEALALSKQSLSAQTKRFLVPEKKSGGLFSTRWRLGFRPKWLEQLTGSRMRQNVTAINEVLEWMESEMEIRNDQ